MSDLTSPQAAPVNVTENRNETTINQTLIVIEEHHHAAPAAKTHRPAPPKHRQHGPKEVDPIQSDHAHRGSGIEEGRSTLSGKLSSFGKGTSVAASIRPDISFASDGDKLTIYRGPDGATATYREDKQNGNAVTLTLQDGNGTLTTHGDRRGFELRRTDALGHVKSEGVTLDTYWKSPLDIGSVLDKVNCPNGGLKGTNILPAITGDVTRDKLQQFAAAHPQLADTLNHVRLPATISGGRQFTFSDAQIEPSEFRACPIHESKGIVRK